MKMRDRDICEHRIGKPCRWLIPHVERDHHLTCRLCRCTSIPFLQLNGPALEKLIEDHHRHWPAEQLAFGPRLIAAVLKRRAEALADMPGLQLPRLQKYQHHRPVRPAPRWSKTRTYYSTDDRQGELL